MKKTLKVSEHFYSLQGEGITIGRPSVFLRLTGCNLLCGGQGTQRDGQLHDGATWRCDTIETWMEGEEFTLENLARELVENYKEAFESGAGLIITGGEPLLRKEELTGLLLHWYRRIQVNPGMNTVEVETNGTIEPDLPSREFDRMVHLYNVSPKLSNSGMPAARRIKPGALKRFAKFAHGGRAIFKFVVKDGIDVFEAEEDFIEKFDIPAKAVWLMPACSNREELESVAPGIAELAIKRGYNFSPRLQIVIWNQTTGV